MAPNAARQLGCGLGTLLAAVLAALIPDACAVQQQLVVMETAPLLETVVRRRHLLAASVNGGGIAGIVVGMAVMAALLGAACFLLGRRAAREAALAAADGGRDVEIGLLSSSEHKRSSTTAMLVALGKAGNGQGELNTSSSAAADPSRRPGACVNGHPAVHSPNGGPCVLCEAGGSSSQVSLVGSDPGEGRITAPSGRFASPSNRSTDPNMAVMESLDLEIQSWFVDPSEIEVCRRPDGSEWLLGQGSYGKVYKALRGGVQEVAVKVLLCTDEDQLVAFNKEIGILKSISYDRNIVQFYGACIRSASNEPMLLLEYCEGGDVRRALTADCEMAEASGVERRLGWYAAGQHIALDVARGLHFLHKSGVTHGDMKAQNILITGRWAKITDVGVARVMAAPEQADVAITLGTFAYAAPEMLLGADWDTKADIYSFGVVLWEICTGALPNRGRLWAPETPEQCPAGIAALIKECMRPIPAERPTAKEIFDRMQAETLQPPPPSPLPQHETEVVSAFANEPGQLQRFSADQDRPLVRHSSGPLSEDPAGNIQQMLMRTAHSSLTMFSAGSNSSQASPGSSSPATPSGSFYGDQAGVTARWRSSSSGAPSSSGRASLDAAIGVAANNVNMSQRPSSAARSVSSPSSRGSGGSNTGLEVEEIKPGARRPSFTSSAVGLNPTVAAFSVVRRSMRAITPPDGGRSQSTQDEMLRHATAVAAVASGAASLSPVAADQQPTASRRSIRRATQPNSVEGSLSELRRHHQPQAAQKAAGPPPASGGAPPIVPLRSSRPGSRRSSGSSIRRLSNLGPNPGGIQPGTGSLQPISSGKPMHLESRQAAVDSLRTTYSSKPAPPPSTSAAPLPPPDASSNAATTTPDMAIASALAAGVSPYLALLAATESMQGSGGSAADYEKPPDRHQKRQADSGLSPPSAISPTPQRGTREDGPGRSPQRSPQPSPKRSPQRSPERSPRSAAGSSSRDRERERDSKGKRGGSSRKSVSGKAGGSSGGRRSPGVPPAAPDATASPPASPANPYAAFFAMADAPPSDDGTDTAAAPPAPSPPALERTSRSLADANNPYSVFLAATEGGQPPLPPHQQPEPPAPAAATPEGPIADAVPPPARTSRRRSASERARTAAGVVESANRRQALAVARRSSPPENPFAAVSAAEATGKQEGTANDVDGAAAAATQTPADAAQVAPKEALESLRSSRPFTPVRAVAAPRKKKGPLRKYVSDATALGRASELAAARRAAAPVNPYADFFRVCNSLTAADITQLEEELQEDDKEGQWWMAGQGQPAANEQHLAPAGKHGEQARGDGLAGAEAAMAELDASQQHLRLKALSTIAEARTNSECSQNLDSDTDLAQAILSLRNQPSSPTSPDEDRQEVLQKHADSRAVKQAQHHQFREKQQQQRQQHEQRRQDKEQRRALKDKAQAGPRDQAQQDQQPQDQTDGALSIATPFARISADRAKEQLLQPLQRSSAGSHADDHADEQPKLRGSSGDLRPGSVARPEISFDAPGVPQTLAVRTASAILAAQASESAAAADESLRIASDSSDASGNPYALFALRPTSGTLPIFSLAASPNSKGGHRSAPPFSVLRTGPGGKDGSVKTGSGSAPPGGSLSPTKRSSADGDWGEATSNPFERLSDFNATGSSPKAPQQRSSLRGGPSTGMSPSKSQQDLAAAAIAVLAAAGYDTAAAAMHGLSAEEAAATVTLGGGSARARASASPFQPADGSGSAGKMHRPSKGLLSPAEQLRSSLYGKQTAAAAVADLRPASAPGPQARGKVEDDWFSTNSVPPGGLQRSSGSGDAKAALYHVGSVGSASARRDRDRNRPRLSGRTRQGGSIPKVPSPFDAARQESLSTASSVDGDTYSPRSPTARAAAEKMRSPFKTSSAESAEGKTGGRRREAIAADAVAGITARPLSKKRGDLGGSNELQTASLPLHITRPQTSAPTPQQASRMQRAPQGLRPLQAELPDSDLTDDELLSAAARPAMPFEEFIGQQREAAAPRPLLDSLGTRSYRIDRTKVASEGGLAIAPGDKRRAFLAAAAVAGGAEGRTKAASDSLTNTQQDLYIPLAALSPKKSAALQAVQGGLKRHASLGAHTLPLRQSKSAAAAHPGSPGKSNITTRSGEFTPHHSADVFIGSRRDTATTLEEAAAVMSRRAAATAAAAAAEAAAAEVDDTDMYAAFMSGDAPGSNVYASFASEPASSELPKPAGSDLYSSIAPPTITSTNSASVADSRNPYSMYALPAGDSSLSGAVGGDTAEPPHSGSAGGRERKGRGTVSTVSRSSTKLGGSRGGKRSESDRRKGVPAAPSSGRRAMPSSPFEDAELPASLASGRRFSSMPSGGASPVPEKESAESSKSASAGPHEIKRSHLRRGRASVANVKAASMDGGSDEDSGDDAPRRPATKMKSIEPVQLRGKERKKALEEAEAAAEAELSILISDNSFTWNI